MNVIRSVAISIIATMALIIGFLSQAKADGPLLLHGFEPDGSMGFCAVSYCLVYDADALEAVLRGDRCVLWSDTLKPVIDDNGFADMRGRKFVTTHGLRIPPMRLGSLVHIDALSGRKLAGTDHILTVERGTGSVFRLIYEEQEFKMTGLQIEAGPGPLIATTSGAPLLTNVILSGSDWIIDHAAATHASDCGKPTS